MILVKVQSDILTIQEKCQSGSYDDGLSSKGKKKKIKLFTQLPGIFVSEMKSITQAFKPKAFLSRRLSVTAMMRLTKALS